MWWDLRLTRCGSALLCGSLLWLGTGCQTFDKAELTAIGERIALAARELVDTAITKSADLTEQQRLTSEIARVSQQRQNRFENRLEEVATRLSSFSDMMREDISRLDLQVNSQLARLESTARGDAARLARLEAFVNVVPTRDEMKRIDETLSTMVTALKTDLTTDLLSVSRTNKEAVKELEERGKQSKNFLLAVFGSVVGVLGVTIAGLSTMRSHRMLLAREAERRTEAKDEVATSAVAQIAELKSEQRTAMDRFAGLIRDVQENVRSMKVGPGPGV